MFASVKTLAVISIVGGGAIICPLCESGNATTTTAAAIPQAVDTSTVRLHISGMTCGSCPTTARLALTRVPGVYSAAVTLADSLGIVRYDGARVSAKEIATQLTKRTGYVATVLPDTAKTTRGARGG